MKFDSECYIYANENGYGFRGKDEEILSLYTLITKHLIEERKVDKSLLEISFMLGKSGDKGIEELGKFIDILEEEGN